MRKTEFLSPREAAIRLGISLNAIYALLWAGKLQGRKEDNQWQVSADAVAARIKAKER
jgi:hypothetical protein